MRGALAQHGGGGYTATHCLTNTMYKLALLSNSRGLSYVAELFKMNTALARSARDRDSSAYSPG